jgi:dihydroxyacid dehydratase/phosphogluconate dehydratase
VRDGDIIEIDAARAKLNVVATVGGARGRDVEAALERRLEAMPPFEPGRRKGLFGLYTSLAGPPERGARMEW